MQVKIISCFCAFSNLKAPFILKGSQFIPLNLQDDICNSHPVCNTHGMTSGSPLSKSHKFLIRKPCRLSFSSFNKQLPSNLQQSNWLFQNKQVVMKAQSVKLSSDNELLTQLIQRCFLQQRLNFIAYITTISWDQLLYS